MPRARTWRLLVQSQAGLPVPLPPIKSRLPVPTRVVRLTGAQPQPCAAAKYPRRDSNAHCLASHASASALGYEDEKPSSGADPDLLPYEGKVTAVCDGHAAGQGLEPR